jgi:hypothetical protein
METIKHTGVSPFLDDPSYAVFRNVKDFGAKGDGIADDTEAIQRAIDGTKSLSTSRFYFIDTNGRWRTLFYRLWPW